MKYFSLHIQTEYSLLSSMIKIPELITHAKQNGIDTLGITDTNLYGVMEFLTLCKKNNIQPILGLEVTIENTSICLYARNYEGYQNLCKLQSIQSKEPVSFEELTKYSSHLIAILPYESMPYLDVCKKLYEHYFIGYSNEEERKQIPEEIRIYFPRVYYLNEKDKEYYPYLLGVKEGIPVKKVFLDANNHACLSKEEDFRNFETIKQLCHLEIPKQKELLPIFVTPNGMDSYSYLKELCKEGMKKIFHDRVPKVYVERLKYELDVISKMGYVNYFLIVWDYVHYAKEHHILVGPGRGSAAGSLVSYLIGITNVDPIRYHLLFERFLNPERISMPDIDVDFEFNRREEVITYCTNKYGVKKVAGIITFGTLASKQVIRDVGRTMEIDLKVIDVICKMLDSKETLKTNFEKNPKLKSYLKMEPELQKLYQIAVRLEGLKRHKSIHAAGIVMTNVDLDTVIPLDYNHENFYTTGYSMEYLEDLGLLKMDFLALRNLTIISTILEDLKKESIVLDFEEIPLDDKETFEIFQKTNTIGIFQFESQGMMNFIRKFQPSNFEEITAALALFRPGPMNNIDHYIKRKKGLEKIDYLHPDLEAILKPTYGILIYQEQIMQVAHTLAGYSLGEADILRKAISKKKEEVMLQEREKFVSRSIQNGYTKELSEKVYDLILKFASYGFNRAHSVAYAMISYRMAYLKAHYTKQYLKALLSMVIGSEIKTKEYIYECKLNHIEVLKPDINLSEKDYTLTDFGIRFPLTGIKKVGTSSVTSILEERKKGKFRDIYDFIKRISGKNVNKGILESLIYSGALSSFGFNQKTLITNLDNLLNYGELLKDLSEEFVEKPELEYIPEYSKKELMEKELETFGFYLSNHPVTEEKCNYPSAISLNELEPYFDKEVEVIFSLDRKKEVLTKKNEKMCFLSGSDEISSIDAVLFPKVYEKYSDLEVGDILLLHAKVEKRFDKLQLIVNDVTKLKEKN